MTPENYDRLGDQGANSIEEIFRREDQKLLEKLRAKDQAEATYDLLAKATGIGRRDILEKLKGLHISAEAAAALAVLPFVEVAWADGKIDAKENATLLELAQARGFMAGTAERTLLEAWLTKRPESRYFAAWQHTMQGLCEQLTPQQAGELKKTVVERARAVAGISGGILGIGKVSAQESAMIERIEKTFARG